MNDQLMSLSKIFTDRIFRIPDYQRGYAWTEKEVSDFWNDLCRLNQNNNHYVGVLTLEPVCEEIYSDWIDDTWLIKSKCYQPFYIVDGQQRLTTSILLIKTIIEIMQEKSISKLNFTSKEDIIKRFVSESKDENQSNSYLFCYEINNPSYNYLVYNIYQNKTGNDSLLQETTYTINLEKAKGFFMKKLDELSLEELEEVYVKISQRFLFNTYEISTDIDVFVTFETMNNRGKPLSHLELLKNRMIYLSTLFNVDEDVKNRLRRDINLCWKDIYHFLGKNKNRQLPDDEFLNAHFQLYFCDSLKETQEKFRGSRRMFYEVMYFRNDFLLEEHFVPQNIAAGTLTVEEVFKYTENLKNSITQWNVINNPEYSGYSEEIIEYLKKLNHLDIINLRRGLYPPFVSQHRVMLLACLEINKKETTLLKLLKALEKYMFINRFIPYECYSVDNRNNLLFDFGDAVIKLNKGDITITGIYEKLNKITATILESKEINQKLISYYSKNGFYNEDFIKYFLCEYEVALMKQSKSGIERLDREIFFSSSYNSIEHIYPQNAHHKYWIDIFQSYSQKQRNILRNSLGNLVCISKEKNSKLGNKPFPEKKENRENTLGYKYGTYSEIQLTNYSDWTAKEILERGIKLTTFLNERWDIKIGDGTKAKKIEFLGLSFVQS